MLAANSAVADELIERKIPGIFRVHPEPDPGKLDEFSFFVRKTFGLSCGDLTNRSNCCAFLEHLPSDHRKPVVISNFLRALPRASYLEENALQVERFLTGHPEFRKESSRQILPSVESDGAYACLLRRA